MMKIQISKLLGRGSVDEGTIEEITLGTNLAMSGTTLNATGGTGGYYEPLTNGIAATPELLFALGDVIMVLVV